VTGQFAPGERADHAAITYDVQKTSQKSGFCWRIV